MQAWQGVVVGISVISVGFWRIARQFARDQETLDAAWQHGLILAEDQGGSTAWTIDPSDTEAPSVDDNGRLPAPTADHWEGRSLYGDDFTPDHIRQWFAEEADETAGYASIADRRGAAWKSGFAYAGELAVFAPELFTRRTAFRGRLLGFGSADGAELLPLVPTAARVDVVEPSIPYHQATICGRPVTYHEARPDGGMPFLGTASIDATICHGVLHHIPNVSAVLAEIGRVTASGGWLYLHEPIVSMGDWRTPRRGLTAHERGIPLDLLCQAVERAGFTLVRAKVTGFRPFVRMMNLLGLWPYSRPWAMRINGWLAELSRPWYRYHTANRWRRSLGPTAVAIMARRT